MSDNHTLWRGRRGRRIRDIYLGSVYGLCEPCRAEGRTSVAVEVHHKVPLEKGGAVFDWNNMLAVCAYHHKQAHHPKPEIDPATGLPIGGEW